MTTTRPSTFAVAMAAAADADAIGALFDACDCRCFCRYFHFAGDKNDWLARCYGDTSVNRAEWEAAISTGSSEASGVVARFPHTSDVAAGWLKVAPAESVQKAYEQRLYKNLPCFSRDSRGVYHLSCALVHPDARKKGLCRQMVRCAIEHCRDAGASSIEAFPRRPRTSAPDEELWTLPVSTFVDAGFQVVHDLAPYPVMRLDL